MRTRDIVIDPPIVGHWGIYNPPGHPILAYDFLAEDERASLYRKGGFLRHLFSFIPVEDTLAWSSPVFSPVNGVVVASHDTESDRTRISFAYDLFSLLVNKPKVTDGFRAFGGNHIMIRTDDCFVLLCHLKNGTARVKQGDALKAGQQIAEVGNSGSSIQPHLHLQIMGNEQYFPLFANLLPFKFTRAKVKQGGKWESKTTVELRNRTHYLFERERS